MSAQVIGETVELKEQTVKFNAVHEVTGVSGSGSFPLIEANGLSEYVGTHAFVRLVGETVRVSIRGPVSSTIACTVDACVIPDDDDIERPTTAAQIATVQGNASAQHSLLVGVQDSTLFCQRCDPHSQACSTRWRSSSRLFLFPYQRRHCFFDSHHQDSRHH